MDQIGKAKKMAAAFALNWVEPKMRLGLGTGSTTEFFIRILGAACRRGLDIQAVASSVRSQQLAVAEGVPLLPIEKVDRLDLTFDGADAIDPTKRLIKGGGGALLREKILAVSSEEMIVLVDESKLVQALGSHPLPVEVIPFCFHLTLKRISALGVEGRLRKIIGGENYRTDNGNLIFDIEIKGLAERLTELHIQLLQVPGVLETGFFEGIAGRVVMGMKDGTVRTY